jgi:hypothetical protein
MQLALFELRRWRQSCRCLLLVSIFTAGLAQALDLQSFDLRRDWSTNANPNGPWRYRSDSLVLPAYTWGDSFTNRQPSWQRPFDGTLPVWFLSTTDPVPANRDWKAGDIIVHTQDENHGFGQGQANVVWTSPFDGMVNIAGHVWLGRKVDRANNWKLFVRGNLVTQGFIAYNDAYTRENPFWFEGGTGGTNVLRSVPVAVGDEIMLEIRRTSVFGEYVGVNLTITQTIPDPDLTAEVGCVRVCFATASNVWYQLQHSTALATNDWFPTGTNFIQGNGQRFCTEFSMEPGQPARYYRLAVTNAPPSP